MAPERSSPRAADLPNDADLAAAYRRFCRHGRPEDLAAVFDATAPGLLLLAAHLSDDRTGAEDLVQTTFLQLIERGGPPADAPILPWLLRVVANRAHDHRRREHRRREHRQREHRQGRRRAPTRHENATDPDPGPFQHCMDAETTRLVGDAIAVLPENLRQVLVLHFLHGLAPQQIAHALGRPPATVRSWLHRGLRRLRGSLPSGAAITTALTMFAGDGLAQLRCRILAALPFPSPVTGLALTGGLAMKKFLTGLCVLLAASLTWLAWYGLPGLPQPESAPGPGAIATDRIDVDGAAAAPAGKAPHPTPVRTSLPAAATPPAVERGRTVRFSGRCVAAEDGRPLPGATIRAKVYEKATMQHQVKGTCTADAAGCFSILVASDVDDPRNVYNFSCWAEDRTPSYCSFQPALLGEHALLGDVPIRSGREVRIRVSDDGGGCD